MRELSLFTGAGGGLLGSLILGWEPVQFVEHEPYCQKVLARRCPAVPLHDDVRTFHPVPGSCDIVTGGFPCQPHSQAGKRLGGLDSRDLWPDTLRILRESEAPLGFFENVPGLLTSRDADGHSMFGGILGDLSEAGFNAEWCVLGADDVGAPHRRKRLWILAVAHGSVAGVQPGAVGGTPRGSGRDAALDVPSGRGEVSGGGAELADAEDFGHEWRGTARGWGDGPADSGSPWRIDPADVGHAVRADGDGYELDPWLAEPYVGRVATGVAARVGRLRALGNGQVPQTMAAAFTLLAREAGVSQ